MAKIIGSFIGYLIGKIFIRPIVHFWIGFLAGCFLQLILSNAIIFVFSIFNISIEPSYIPYIFGFIGLVSSFFKPNDYEFELYDEEEE